MVAKKQPKNKKKLVVWALFDDGNCSYKKAIKKYFDGKFVVHCFGINKQPFKNSKNYYYHELNLSLTNDVKIKDCLDKVSKPDIILASPPCESWSIADCGGRMVISIGSKKYQWIIKNHDYYDQIIKKCHPVKRRYFKQKEISRINGENTIGATIWIIGKYKPKIWIIENPATSKIWEYIENHWCWKIKHKNKTYYSSYDKHFSTKPTIFASNIELNLKSKKIKGNNDHMARGNYDKRSAIPYELIHSIVKKIILEIK